MQGLLHRAGRLHRHILGLVNFLCVEEELSLSLQQLTDGSLSSEPGRPHQPAPTAKLTSSIPVLGHLPCLFKHTLLAREGATCPRIGDLEQLDTSLHQRSGQGLHPNYVSTRTNTIIDRTA